METSEHVTFTPTEAEDGTLTFVLNGVTATAGPEAGVGTLSSTRPVLLREGQAHLLLVEGVLDAVAVATHASAEYAVAVYTDPAQLHFVDHISRGITNVSVLIRGIDSPSENRAQWTKATAAVKAVTESAAAPKLVTGAPSGGWGPFLAQSMNAAEAIARKLNNPVKIPARPPAAVKTAAAKALAPNVDWANGVISSMAGGEPHILIDCAARITRVRSLIDDMNGLDENGKPTRVMNLLDLEVAIGAGDSQRVYAVTSVPERQLRDPLAWLGKIHGGAGATVKWLAGEQNTSAIANAIKGHDSDLFPRVTEFYRTGWVELAGEWVFLHATGAIGERGETFRSRGILTGTYKRIAFPDPADVDASTALKSIQDMVESMTDPTALYVALGVAFSRVAGAPVGCVPYFHGDPDAGKTLTLHFVNSMLSPRWGASGDPLEKIDNSGKNIGSFGTGLENLWVNADDTRPRADRSNAAAAQAEGVENLIRRGFEAGAGYAAKVQNSDTGAWEKGTPEATSPAIMLAGEELPDATVPGQLSTVQRTFPVRIRRGRLFTEEGVKKAVAISDSPLPQQALAVFIRFIAAQIGKRESREAWLSELADLRTTITESLKEKLTVSRVARVASVPAVGMRIFADCLVAHGVLTGVERDSLVTDVDAHLLAAASAHIVENLSGTAEHDIILAALREQAASGSYVIFRTTGMPAGATEATYKLDNIDTGERNRVRLGFESTTRDGDRFIAIHPQTALDALNGRVKTTARLALILAPISIKDSAGKLTRPAKFGNNYPLTRHVCIPLDVWDAAEAE